MHHAVIPVVLQFRNIAANSNLNFTFTTGGVKWSLGWRMGDSLGFSYNVIPDDINSTDSSLQNVSVNGDVLSLRTAANAPASNDFTLTLFLEVKQDTEYLQGYCTLNNEAEVLAYFGNERPVRWVNGRISAVLRPPAADYRSVLLAVKGARPGSLITIEVNTNPEQGQVVWTLGPPFAESLGFSVSSGSAQIPLSQLSYTNNQIRLITQSSAASTTTPVDIALLAYVSWEPKELPYIYLKTIADPSVSVFAQVGTRQPQLVSPTYTLFTL